MVAECSCTANFIMFIIVCNSQTEREEFETENKQKYERERAHLTDDNKKLTSEVEKVRSVSLSKTHVPMFMIFISLCLFHHKKYTSNPV